MQQHGRYGTELGDVLKTMPRGDVWIPYDIAMCVCITPLPIHFRDETNN